LVVLKILLSLHHNNKQIEIMTSATYQKRMNMYLGVKKFRLAYKSFLKMNELRLQEGLEFFTMPNLQAKFEK
jgi:hypothetical protein